MQKNLYFDNAATTPTSPLVLEKMLPYFSENFGNPSSTHQIGQISKNAINIAREQVATALNCNFDEIYFTSGGSESDNMIIKGIALANQKFGKHIITSKIEHSAVLDSCKYLEHLGFRVTYLNIDKQGFVNLKELENSISSQTTLITIMYANNEIGTIQNVTEIGNIAKKHNIFFHSDAVQAIGNVEVDVQKSNLSALSLSGHKFHAPKGIGVSYIKKGVPFNRFNDGGHQEFNKRGGTENLPGIVGIGEAIELATKNLFAYSNHLSSVRNYYINKLTSTFNNVIINGSLQNRLPGNMNVIFPGVNGKFLTQRLSDFGICTSSGSACSAGLYIPSHVLLALGFNENLAKGSLRTTFGIENTFKDIDFLIEKLKEILL